MTFLEESISVPSHAESFNRTILRHIPLTARVIFDVGCGDGALAGEYRRFNPMARIYGIETNLEAATLAAPHLDGIARTDVEDNPSPFDLSEGVDCIIYRNVLEYLADPWSTLRIQAEHLGADGTILMCLPNQEHWHRIERVLRGDAREVGSTSGTLPGRALPTAALPVGLSIDAMRECLARVGLILCAVYPLNEDLEEAAAFIDALAPGLVTFGLDPESLLRRYAPRHYLWCVRKAPLQLMTVAASMLAPVGGVSHVRIADPLQAMATDPSIITYISPGGDRQRVDSHSPRVFILHRPALTGANGLATIEALLRDDWVIVTEFDDHPDFFEVMRGDNQFSFSGVHAVQTSTPPLAAILCQRNPEIAVFPNAIRELPDAYNFVNPHQMTVFFGALNRENDWAPLMPALNAVASAMGERLRFCVLHDRGFFEALETPHKTFTPTCDYDTYLKLLGGCEISLMPLQDTPFNRAKSDLKFIEAGACRVVPLASDIVYAASIDDGSNGLLFRNADEMRSRLLRIIAMPDVARDLANAARSHVAAKRMLAYQVAPRLRWYRSLWERREQLTEALTDRLKLAGVA